MVAAATGIPRLPIAAARERGPPVEGQRGRDALPRVRIPFAAAQERGPPVAAARGTWPYKMRGRFCNCFFRVLRVFRG